MPGQGAARVRPDDWAGCAVAHREEEQDASEGGLRREPELSEHNAVEQAPVERARNEFDVDDIEADDDAVRQRALARAARVTARQAAMDPSDGVEL